MIDDVDRTLRLLLKESLGLADAEVRFDRPDDRFAQATKGSRALCLYLYDVRENRELRRADRVIERRGDGTAEVRPPALRFDLSYLVTAWGKSVEEEHELLGRALVVLLAHPVLEPELLQGGLREQDLAIPTAVGQPDNVVDPSSLWGGLGGVRPALFYSVTVPVNPLPAEERRLVAARLLRVSEKMRDAARPVAMRRPDELIDFAGKVLAADGQPIPQAQVSLREVSRSVAVDDTGVFRIGRLTPGRYTLVASAPGFREARREILLSDRSGIGRSREGYDLTLEREKA